MRQRANTVEERAKRRTGYAGDEDGRLRIGRLHEERGRRLAKDSATEMVRRMLFEPRLPFAELERGKCRVRGQLELFFPIVEAAKQLKMSSCVPHQGFGYRNPLAESLFGFFPRVPRSLGNRG